MTIPPAFDPTNQTRTGSCQDGEFSCDNGEQCIPDSYLDDGIFDCSDRSDEPPGKEVTDLIKNLVTITKKVYKDDQLKSLKINMSVSIKYDRVRADDMDRNGKVLGYSIEMTSSQDNVVKICSRVSCHIFQDEMNFDRDEQYKIAVRPVTRSILKKASQEKPTKKASFPILVEFRQNMDSLLCTKNGRLVETRTNELCNPDSENDCNDCACDEDAKLCNQLLVPACR